MATNTNSSSWLQNPLSVFMTLIPFLMLLLHAQNVKSLSFQFRVGSFGPNDTNGIIFQGDAFASNGALYLTKMENGSPVQHSVGRASYGVPIRLWDAKTGELAGFTTFFDFVLAQNGGDPLGDGITFFIAPFESNIPNNSCGGYLGLVSPDSALNSYQNPIVAVEFDTFSGNQWDPETSHVGIDVNSIVSRTTEAWETNNGASTSSLVSAAIRYEAVSKELSVSVSYVGSRGNESPTKLAYVIDLRTVLPEFVRVGFSGSTGNLVERHRILDWTFTSTL